MSSQERLFDHGFRTMSSIEWAGRFDGNIVGIRSMPLVNDKQAQVLDDAQGDNEKARVHSKLCAEYDARQ